MAPWRCALISAQQATITAAFGTAQVQTHGQTTILTPASIEALSAMLGLATQERWPLTIVGAGHWHTAAPASGLVLRTSGLTTLGACHSEDLHLSTASGVPWDLLQEQAAAAGTCVMLDPPGCRRRTVGSILATATTGGLQHRAGPVRDQVLGLTVVTGTGEVVRTGGTTVKNVAGFDLMKLHLGGFGRYGVIAEATLRLHAVPAVDRTWCCPLSPADALALPAALPLLQEAAAVDLLIQPSGETSVVVRWQGPATVVDHHQQALAQTCPGPWCPSDSETDAGAHSTVSVRFGVLPSQHHIVLPMLAAVRPAGLLRLGLVSGLARWQGDLSSEALIALRAALAPLAIPLTVERAPGAVLRTVGHFGAPAPALLPVLARLQQTFDPAGILSPCVEAAV